MAALKLTIEPIDPEKQIQNSLVRSSALKGAPGPQLRGGPGGPDPCPFSLKSESTLFLGKFETSV